MPSETSPSDLVSCAVGSAAARMLCVYPALCQLPCHLFVIMLNHLGKVWWLDTVEHSQL